MISLTDVIDRSKLITWIGSRMKIGHAWLVVKLQEIETPRKRREIIADTLNPRVISKRKKTDSER